jgi:hypothetical protein
MGGVQNGVTTRGPWSEDDRDRHINELELLAVFSLKAFTGNLCRISVRLMMDNFTAVQYVNNSWWNQVSQYERYHVRNRILV